MSAPLLPELTPENTAFWTSGARGELMIAHCDACDHAIHPPELICPKCLSRRVTPRAARGSGTVHSFTTNHQRWLPDLTVPYTLVVVDLDGQPGVRLTARLDDADAADVAIGQRVQVGFVQAEDVWIPHFRRMDG